MKMEMPNVRRIFLPDPGYTIAEVDLSGADAQVVAWEAGDADLKAAFRAGLKVHRKNATDMLGATFTEADPIRQAKLYHNVKQIVHATNYGASARTLAMILGWRIAEVESFQSRWFALHPKIPHWHNSVQRALRESRTVRNAFGFRRSYFDRIEGILPKALAWIPQSTIAVCCSKGMIQLEARVPECELLLQVHDSVVFQFPTRLRTPGFLSQVKAALRVPVPYPDPLEIPWELSLSEISWGDCAKANWDGTLKPE